MQEFTIEELNIYLKRDYNKLKGTAKLLTDGFMREMGITLVEEKEDEKMINEEQCKKCDGCNFVEQQQAQENVQEEQKEKEDCKKFCKATIHFVYEGKYKRRTVVLVKPFCKKESDIKFYLFPLAVEYLNATNTPFDNITDIKVIKNNLGSGAEQ